MERLSWFIQVDPKYNHMCHYKREAEGDLMQIHRGEGDAKTEKIKIWICWP